MTFWQAALAAGHDIAAVGVSDSHTAVVDPEDPNAGQGSAIGGVSTVVYAPELSEAGILAGVRAGHTYVKLFGNGGPDLRFVADGDAGGSGIMGDAIPDASATLEATVTNLALDADTHTLRLLRDGASADAVPVSPPGDVHAFRAEVPGSYRIQLEQADGTIVALTSPIAVPEAGASLGSAAVLAVLAALRGARRFRAATAATGASAAGSC